MDTDPLPNPRHEAFAFLVAGGASAAEAYRKAGFKCSNATAQTNGPALSREAHMRLRIADLKRKAQERAKEREADGVLTLAEKRLFLARVLRTPVGQVTADSDLAQEVTVDEKSMKVKMPDKLRALALDNDLAIEGAEANKEAMTIIVRIGGSDDGDGGDSD